MFSSTALNCLLIVIGLIGTAAADQASATLKDKYHIIQVEKFEIREGVDFPPEYLASLQDELVKQLQESRKFEAVLRPGENPPTADTPVLRLSGTISKFNKGNRAKRYFGGMGGAGATQIFAHLVFLDRSSGQVLIAEETVGTLAGGLFGGESKDVTSQFARTVANTTKLVLVRSLSAPTHPPALPVPAGGAASGPESQALEIRMGELPAGQQKLNELAAVGFRLTAFTVTSNKSATLTLEKSATPPNVYQYQILHAIMPGNLQKNMNKGAAEGYRVAAHTIAQMGGLTVIMEKAPGPPPERYEYRLHVTMRVSSAEKDVLQDQAQGFVLVDTAELMSQHAVILEKAVVKNE